VVPKYTVQENVKCTVINKYVVSTFLAGNKNRLIISFQSINRNLTADN